MKTINNSKKFVVAAVAGIWVASFAIGAHAGESAAAPARTVHYSDLNLNTQAGAETLYRRIQMAANSVCGDVESRQLSESAAAKACAKQAVADSVRAVNNRLLTGIYDQHNGVVRTTLQVASLR